MLFTPLLDVFFELDLRILRSFRLLLLIKLSYHTNAFNLLQEIVWRERYILIIAFFWLCFALVFFSTAIYFVEKEVQPEKFGSIPAAMWWAIATLTTVGYGDVVPITLLGKFFSGVIMLTGIIFLALPISILSISSAYFFKKKENSKTKQGKTKTADRYSSRMDS